MRKKMIIWGAALALGVVTVSCGEKRHRDTPNEGERTGTTSGEALQNVNPQFHVDQKDHTDPDLTGADIGGNVMTPRKSIMENVSVNTDLVHFTSALKQANMVNVLNGTGPYTVFAPTDQAFENMQGRNLGDLMQPENQQQLQQILNNHVVAGKLAAADLQDGTMLKTLGGKQLRVTKRNNQVMVDGAAVEEADAESSNGVIHVINRVLTNNQ